MGTYPDSPSIAQGTGSTPVNAANHNIFVDNLNAIAEDLRDGRGDGDAWPIGTPHTSGQAADLDNMLDILRHMLKSIGGETNYYDDPAGSLKVHDHTTGQGGAIVWSSIAANTRFAELHPQYPGAVITNSLRGAAASGDNEVTESSDQDVVSNVARNYYENTSAELSLQDSYRAVRFTLPENFTAWAESSAIQIEYKTESGTSINCHVDVYIYKSGTEAIVTNDENNANTSWSTITIDDSNLGSWSASDIMEIYIKLETRSDYYARCGKIRFNYTS